MRNTRAQDAPVEVLAVEGFSARSLILQFKPANLFGEIVCLRKDKLMNNAFVCRGKLRELEVHRSVRHPNILQLIDTCQTEQDVRFAYEWCDTKSLEELLLIKGKMPLDFAVNCCLQVLEGLHALLKAGWLHYNINASSLYLCNDTVKVGQLQNCIRKDEAEHFECSGRVFAIAPELLEGGEFTTKSLVWALGASLYQVLHGTVPFQAEDLESLVRIQSTQSPNLLVSLSRGHFFEQVLAQMLEPDQERRISFEELLKYRRKLSALLDHISPLKIVGVKYVLQSVLDPTWICIPGIRFTKELDPLKALLEESSAVNCSLSLDAIERSKRNMRLSYMLVLSTIKFSVSSQSVYQLTNQSKLMLALIHIAVNLLKQLSFLLLPHQASPDPKQGLVASLIEQEAATLQSLSTIIAKKAGTDSAEMTRDAAILTVNQYIKVMQSNRLTNGRGD